MTDTVKDTDGVGLLPCPFCGDLAGWVRDEHIFAGQNHVDYPGQTHGFLVECRGACHSATCWWHTKEQAFAAWNRRPAAPTEAVGEEPVRHYEHPSVGSAAPPDVIRLTGDGRVVAEDWDKFLYAKPDAEPLSLFLHPTTVSGVGEEPPEATTDISGDMWKAGRFEFAKYAERYRAATTTEAAETVADIAPAEIWRAMRQAELILAIDALSRPSPGSGAPDYFAIHSANGMHVGLWEERADAERVAKEYPGCVMTPLYLSPPSYGEGIEATHQHKKRGTKYVLIGFGKMQAARWIIPHELLSEPSHTADMAEVAIYRSVDNGSLWVRPREEFEDGRFVALPQQGGK